MEEKNYTGAVPDNLKGNQVDATSVKELPSAEMARSFFEKAKVKLLDVNRWNEVAGEVLAEFQLMDESGSPRSGPASEGLLLRIDIPGPGTKTANGFDWVKIEELSEVDSGDVQSVALRVRPVQAPDSDEDAPSHFYSESATSTFTLSREHNKVTSAIYDRNLEANKESENLFDKVRNAITGVAGKTVFSKVQWQLLADGLVN